MPVGFFRPGAGRISSHFSRSHRPSQIFFNPQEQDVCDAKENRDGRRSDLGHTAGGAGAPKPGDKADWGPRIAQGKDTMYKHAIEGFTGAKGMMPAKGGSANLTDAEVKAAVDYMADKSL